MVWCYKWLTSLTGDTVTSLSTRLVVTLSGEEREGSRQGFNVRTLKRGRRGSPVQKWDPIFGLFWTFFFAFLGLFYLMTSEKTHLSPERAQNLLREIK